MIEISKYTPPIITTEEAQKLAEKMLSEKGWDIEKYVGMMEDYSDKWVFIFKGREPRPPGDEMEIHISKKDGFVQVFMGE